MPRTPGVVLPGAAPVDDRALYPGLLLTEHEAAEVLGCSPRTVRELRTRRELPYAKVGRLVRIHRDDLAAYVAAARARGGSANV